MNYRRDKSLLARHPGWSVSTRLVMTVTVLFGLGLFLSSGWYRLEPLVMFLAYPVMIANHFQEGSDLSWRDYFSRQTSLVAARAELEAENASLRLQLLVAEQAAQNYRDLRELLGQDFQPAGRIMAQVISGPGRSPFDVLIIDLGRANSSALAKAIMPLAGQNEILLGRLVSAGQRFSKIRLFSSSGVETPVVIGNEGIPAQAVGRGGGNFIAYLPRSAAVKIGDRATAPMFGGRLLAVVGAVDNNPEEPFQTVYLKSPLNVFTLSWVELYAY